MKRPEQIAERDPLLLLRTAYVFHVNYRKYDLAAHLVRLYDERADTSLHSAYVAHGRKKRAPSRGESALEGEVVVEPSPITGPMVTWALGNRRLPAWARRWALLWRRTSSPSGSSAVTIWKGRVVTDPIRGIDGPAVDLARECGARDLASCIGLVLIAARWTRDWLRRLRPGH